MIRVGDPVGDRMSLLRAVVAEFSFASCIPVIVCCPVPHHHSQKSQAQTFIAGHEIATFKEPRLTRLCGIIRKRKSLRKTGRLSIDDRFDGCVKILPPRLLVR